MNSGSAADIQAETDYISSEDALTITNNAWREAWGYKVQAADTRSQGRMAELAGKNEATTTLVTGGLKGMGYGLAGAYHLKDVWKASPDTGKGNEYHSTNPKRLKTKGGVY